MKRIPLTQGKFALVDDHWCDQINQKKWYAWWNPSIKGFYAVRTEGTKPFQKTIYMHRVIAKTPKGLYCDHINHDTLCNIEGNLRNVTNSQNQMNRGTRSDNRLGESGITAYKTGFHVRVYANNKKVFSKCFRTLAEAKRARDEAIAKYHGKFAKRDFG